MNKFHQIEGIEFDGPVMTLHVDGASYRIELLGVSPALAHASESVRRSFKVSPAGYGIHWPELDEDLSIDGLIKAASKYPAHSPAANVLREKQ